MNDSTKSISPNLAFAEAYSELAASYDMIVSEDELSPPRKRLGEIEGIEARRTILLRVLARMASEAARGTSLTADEYEAAQQNALKLSRFGHFDSEAMKNGDLDPLLSQVAQSFKCALTGDDLAAFGEVDNAISGVLKSNVATPRALLGGMEILIGAAALGVLILVADGYEFRNGDVEFKKKGVDLPKTLDAFFKGIGRLWGSNGGSDDPGDTSGK